MYPGSNQNLRKSLLWILFSTSGADLKKLTFIIDFMTAPLIFLIHRIKKIEKFSFQNFHFPHFLIFGLFFLKELTLENSYYVTGILIDHTGP